jgi:cytoskeletal protein RodZ
MEQTLSQKLKATREARGLAVADVAHATRIPIPRLHQLEAGNYAAFGNMAYARSFLRLYSQFLGVNADTVINELPEPILGGRADYRYLTESFGTWVSNSKEHRPGPMRMPKPRISRAVPAMAMFLILSIATVSVLKAGLLSPQPKSGMAQSTSLPTQPETSVSLSPGMQVTRAAIPGVKAPVPVTVARALPVGVQ